MKLDSIAKPHRIFADYIEHEALRQFEDAMRQPFVRRGALMPDAHTGYSLPIGAVVETYGTVVPSWCGYDIGCGMLAIPTTFDRAAVEKNAQRIFDDIYRVIPVGFNYNERDASWMGRSAIPMTAMARDVFAKNGLKQLGTLGTGNHFIEIGHSDQGEVWIVIHSGSRGIGYTIASYYMKKAAGGEKAKEGHYAFAADSEFGQKYMMDQNFCEQFALTNRLLISRRVADIIRTYCVGDTIGSRMINKNHNHVERVSNNLYIHRKGATQAAEGMLGVIPGNMRDGTFVVRGKGCEEALFSSSHGAGRKMSRSQAKDQIDLGEFQDSMGAIVAKIDRGTLDESPRAYKSIFQVMEDQKELVDIVCHIKPLINIKG